jgi:hypothetical protein
MNSRPPPTPRTAAELRRRRPLHPRARKMAAGGPKAVLRAPLAGGSWLSEVGHSDLNSERTLLPRSARKLEPP